MYSRAERKFLTPDADHANPNLGPGCYTADDQALIAGKTIGNDGYAPFASLTPRRSYFDEAVVAGPSPGAYESPIAPVGLHNIDKASLFGRSRAPRFNNTNSTTPGPGAYVIPSTLRRKKGARDVSGGGVMMRPEVGAGAHLFAQEPGIGGEKRKGRVPPTGTQQIQEQMAQLPPRAPQPQPHQKRQQRPKSGRVARSNGRAMTEEGVEDIAAKVVGEYLDDLNGPDGGEAGTIAAAGDSELPPATAPPPTASTTDRKARTSKVTMAEGLKDPEGNGASPTRPQNSREDGRRSDVGHLEAKRIVISARHSKAGAPSPTTTANGRIVSSASPTRFISSSQEAKRPAIVWRRKYIPPSIPVGRSAFGYQENDEGELIPRKPPKRNTDPGPSYNFVTSFAEKAKHEKHGFSFGRSTKGLIFKIEDSPGPCLYNAEAADKFLNTFDTGNGPALMTLAPCTRLTDAIGVPGPGAYDTKISFHQPRLHNPAVVPAFGNTASHDTVNYLPVEQTKNPGPGAYYPEMASIPKPFLCRPQPFNSTSSRFDSGAEARIRALPAPGSYEIEAVSGMGGRVRRRAAGANNGGGVGGARPKPFGSISERFPARHAPGSLDPGPGAYEIDRALPAPRGGMAGPGGLRKGMAAARAPGGGKMSPGRFSAGDGGFDLEGGGRKRQGRRPKSRKVTILVGGVPVDPSKVRIPVFGTQTERFAEKELTSGCPPPGAYEIAEAFETVKTKGRIQIPSLSNQMARELFPAMASVPGPGEYDVTWNQKMGPKNNDLAHGAFLSTGGRFHDKEERTPGPGAYLEDYEPSLVKKSFNITLGDWSKVVA
ncbi:Sperm-tail PG-rich repeat-containing protein 2 [Irineochytrium annulatum]|nr:Sperm-tail PG-rich repeat-containing protein 2 [Irineochytrium annulatum]